MTTKEQHTKAGIDSVLSLINKKIGKGTLMQGSDKIPGVEFFSSGCPSIDLVLGGGWAKGRICEIYGMESSGKSTLTLHALTSVQKEGGVAAYIDVEHAFDPQYAKCLGVNLETLLFSQPDCGEDALETVKLLADSGLVSLIVVDSVAHLTPKAELEGDIGDSHMGRLARLMGQALRMITASANKNNTTVIFCNQIRMKIGCISPGANIRYRKVDNIG